MTILIHFPVCPFSRSIRLGLAEIDMSFELREEKPWEWRPEFLSINPAGDLPVLELSDGVVISGAYAISEYLGEMVRRAPAEERIKDLFPGNADLRSEVRRLVDWFHRKFDAEVTREMLQHRLWWRLGVGGADRGSPPPKAEDLRALRSNLRYHMGYIGFLSDQRRWLAGDEMSFADLAAAAHLSCLDYLDEVPWEAFPAVQDWYSRIKSRPSFGGLLADRIAGIAPPEHYANLDF